MSYIQSILRRDEKILHIAKLHWMLFIRAILIGLALAAVVVIYLIANTVWALVLVALLALFFLLALASEFFIYRSTELAVTDRRVIHKTGFISRQTMEQQIERTDSITVSQSIFGRILGFGTIDIRGSGSSFTPIEQISNPLKFRNAVQHAIDIST